MYQNKKKGKEFLANFMGDPIFMYSFFTSKKEINNIKRRFWLVTIYVLFQRNDDFSDNWDTGKEGRVIRSWSAVGYRRSLSHQTIEHKNTRFMMLETQNISWGRRKHMAGLNQLMYRCVYHNCIYLLLSTLLMYYVCL